MAITFNTLAALANRKGCFLITKADWFGLQQKINELKALNYGFLQTIEEDSPGLKRKIKIKIRFKEFDTPEEKLIYDLIQIKAVRKLFVKTSFQKFFSDLKLVTIGASLNDKNL